MRLLVSKDQAISIIRERIAELNMPNFNPEVWKNRTELDMKQIFGGLGGQWLQVRNIQFDSYITSEKSVQLQHGRVTALGLLHSYIDFIGQFSVADQQQPVDLDRERYNLLHNKWNSLANDYNSLSEKFETVSNENAVLKNENQKLKTAEIELQNITLHRLWRGLKHLPVSQFWKLIVVVTGLLTALFFIGRWFGGLESKNELDYLKKENRDLGSNIRTGAGQSPLVSETNVFDFDKLPRGSLNYNSLMPTLTIANHSKSPCQSGPIDDCWKTAIGADPGDTISVQIYFKNPSDISSQETTLSIQPSATDGMDSIFFVGGVASKTLQRSVGQVLLKISGKASLHYLKGSARIYRSADNPFQVPNEYSLFESSGLSIGNIAPGDQGIFIVNFAIDK